MSIKPKLSSFKRKKKQSRIVGRKKHVETMFLTNKPKKFPYYFKPRRLSSLVEHNYNNLRVVKKRIHIKTTKSGYLSADPLKAVIRLYKWFSRVNKLEDELRYRLWIFPDFVLTSKPKEMRMGKGKGALLPQKTAIVKKGKVLLTFYCKTTKLDFFLLRSFLKKIMQKLPFKPFICVNEW